MGQGMEECNDEIGPRASNHTLNYWLGGLSLPVACWVNEVVIAGLATVLTIGNGTGSWFKGQRQW